MIQLRHDAREIERQFFGKQFPPGRYELAGALLDRSGGPVGGEPMVLYLARERRGEQSTPVTVGASVVLDSLSHITGVSLTDVRYDGSQVVYTVEPV